MNKKTLSVALVQDRDHGSVEANLANIEARVAEAAARGAKLVLLQELHNGAYFCQHESTHEFDRAEPIPGPSTERLAALNLNTARSMLEDSVANVKTMMGAKDVQDIVALQSNLMQPSIEKAVAYSRSVYEIVSQTQEELSKVVEAQVGEVNKAVTSTLDQAAKQAPAGSDVAVAAVSHPVVAILGPCIHPCCYEFGERELAHVAAGVGVDVTPSFNVNLMFNGYAYSDFSEDYYSVDEVGTATSTTLGLELRF